MNGPQHYREAERLLPIAHDLADQGQQVRADFIVARAQVHATLAAAATSLTPVSVQHSQQNGGAWGGALS